MKVIIIIIAMLLVIGVWIWRTRKSFDQAPNNFVRLESKTGSSKYLPILKTERLDEIEKKYSGQGYEAYPNKYTEIAEILCYEVYAEHDYLKKKQTHAEFLNQLTTVQRIYYTLLIFETQVNNGGVYQFLFNYPELSIIALEAMQSAKLDKLASDYQVVLNEYFGKFNTIQELYRKVQVGNKDWDKRWNDFAEGYSELPSAEIIEDYFYDKEYKAHYRSTILAFVKANKENLYKSE